MWTFNNFFFLLSVCLFSLKRSSVMNLLKATSQTNCLFLLQYRRRYIENTSGISLYLGCCLTKFEGEALVLLSHLAVITNALGRWLISHHELMNNVTRLLIKRMNSDDVLLEKSSVEAGPALLHKSSLHVQTVAWPSSMHFSAPCIQQARNKTTEKPAWLICKLRVMAAIICHRISHSNIWPTTNLNSSFPAALLRSFFLFCCLASTQMLFYTTFETFVKTKNDAGGGISSPHGHWFHAKAQRRSILNTFQMTPGKVKA